MLSCTLNIASTLLSHGTIWAVYTLPDKEGWCVSIVDSLHLIVTNLSLKPLPTLKHDPVFINNISEIMQCKVTTCLKAAGLVMWMENNSEKLPGFINQTLQELIIAACRMPLVLPICRVPPDAVRLSGELTSANSILLPQQIDKDTMQEGVVLREFIYR